MKKLNSLFIGNCQSSTLMNLLNRSNEFKNTFDTKWYANWQLIKDQSSIPIEDIKNADLVIYQPLGEVHGCYSTDPNIEGSIGSYIRPDAIKITHAYIYSSVFWPLVKQKQDNGLWWGNEVIDKLKNNGISNSQILDLYHKNEIDWEYQKRFNESLSILKTRESITDIKVSDYIENNYKNEILFLIPQHPTSKVFLNLANKVLKKLNMQELDQNTVTSINDAGLPDSTYELSSNMFPMHDSIIQGLNLKYVEKYLQNSNNFYEAQIKNYLGIY